MAHHPLHIMQKRVSHFSDWLLDKLDKEEVKLYKKSLLKNSVKLDPINGKPLAYPKALFPVEKAPLEWWYLTGHLEAKGKKFGYELCFFKFHPQALRLGPYPLSKFRKQAFLVLHFALTDKNNNSFNYLHESSLKQKINYNKLELSLNDSSFKFDESTHKFRIVSSNKLAKFKFTLIPVKKIIRHFDKGYAVMYPKPEHRTYYFTFPRLKTKGKLQYKGRSYAVSGLSWFDHQKMNLPHHSPLQGWDWFSIMFDDNTELMFFVLRTKKGISKHHLGGTYIKANSSIIGLSPQDAKIKVLSSWTSPHTKIVYPSGWEISIPKLKLNAKIIPSVKDQELGKDNITRMSYWEGACDVSGTKNGKKITGLSYAELVGYDKRLVTKIMHSFMD